MYRLLNGNCDIFTSCNLCFTLYERVSLRRNKRVNKLKGPLGRLTDAKKAADKKFQIQINLVPVFCSRLK